MANVMPATVRTVSVADGRCQRGKTGRPSDRRSQIDQETMRPGTRTVKNALWSMAPHMSRRVRECTARIDPQNGQSMPTMARGQTVILVVLGLPSPSTMVPAVARAPVITGADQGRGPATASAGAAGGGARLDIAMSLGPRLVVGPAGEIEWDRSGPAR